MVMVIMVSAAVCVCSASPDGRTLFRAETALDFQPVPKGRPRVAYLAVVAGCGGGVGGGSGG